jgi:hypothetical protein
MRMGDASVLADPIIRFFLDDRPSFIQNRPCNSSTVLEMFIRRVDDHIHFFDRDVTLDDLNGLIGGENVFGKDLVHANILPP